MLCVKSNSLEMAHKGIICVKNRVFHTQRVILIRTLQHFRYHQHSHYNKKRSSGQKSLSKRHLSASFVANTYTLERKRDLLWNVTPTLIDGMLS
ncbi:uncharacterized protein PHALS_12659 [Plasmopara halstedii]|uniref:Uncharacterized protein n=1 Tax=Plasmopara halstedii TaxID=4781 RepID=A0A0P1AMK0_PLAHL|nr:uncharacterized protein PHALS_12659 [Plasmopara halstedii]CEG42377.1 hypothetical protein PHALS_12659 [Plasmopara halstedii]|eukprot:XP_024578746.1 hypothetical protein PHALS_12659 [Plasmopara halstedii]